MIIFIVVYKLKGNFRCFKEGRDRVSIDIIAKANDEHEFKKREEIYTK